MTSRLLLKKDTNQKKATSSNSLPKSKKDSGKSKGILTVPRHDDGQKRHVTKPALATSASVPNLSAVLPVRPQQRQNAVSPVTGGAASPPPLYMPPVVERREHAASRPPLYTSSPPPNRGHAASASVYSTHAGSVASYEEPDAELANRISDRMSVIQASIDEDDQPPPYDAELPQTQVSPYQAATAFSTSTLSLQRNPPLLQQKSSSRFSKVWLYANSRLPPALPPLKLYIPTYPVLCLCAAHSLAVYDSNPQPFAPSPPGGRPPSIATVIPSSFRQGTRALTVTTTPLDTSSHIVIAIRGTASLADWAVNTWSAPASPSGFLADAGNLVHAGFLHAAKATAGPLAARLRMVLAEKPERARASLVLTGHSAGGAVAALLYAHILDSVSSASASTSDPSPLRDIAARFTRTHCVTFGAPPVTLLPLQKPAPPSGAPPNSQAAKRLSKSMFFAFVNEGDPVARADPAIARSLLALYASPAPAPSAVRAPVWPVPPGAFSLAGRVVLLRGPTSGNVAGTSGVAADGAPPTTKGRTKGGALAAVLFGRTPRTGSGKAVAAQEAPVDEHRRVSASTISDEMLRNVVYGDPVMHSMRLYKQRVEALAVSAVTAGSMGG